MEERKEAKYIDGDSTPIIQSKHFSTPCPPKTTSTTACASGAMEDEYGQLDCSGELYTSYNFQLECGTVLPEAQACYNTYGRLNARKDNVIVVCHAMTGNARLDQWWGDMLGPGKPFDTSKYFVICANVLGSCYGSTGPRSINPCTGKPYGKDFPLVTIRDTVRLHLEILTEKLKVTSVYAVIGGSMGGMQALEWVFLGRNLVKSAVAIGCGARHSAWQIGFSETQRIAIYNDPKWNHGDIDFNDPPTQGLALARQIAMISYRTEESFHQKFGRDVDTKSQKYQVQSYLHYQGRKFLDRFDALTYVRLTQLMDSHDVTAYTKDSVRVLNDVAETLHSISCPILVLGISSDVLYPLSEQKELARHIPNCTFKVVDSINGHDGFLLEQDQVGQAIEIFLREQTSLN